MPQAVTSVIINMHNLSSNYLFSVEISLNISYARQNHSREAYPEGILKIENIQSNRTQRVINKS